MNGRELSDLVGDADLPWPVVAVAGDEQESDAEFWDRFRALITNITRDLAELAILGNDPARHILHSSRVPYCCPVCQGRGYVPAGLYGGNVASSLAAEPCRTCGGKGVLWSE